MNIDDLYFQANWMPYSIHLADPVPSTITKIEQIARNIFAILVPPIGLLRLCGHAIDHFANKVALPAAYYITQEYLDEQTRKFHLFWEGPITKENSAIRETYTLLEHTVITPDGVQIKAFCMHHKDSIPTTPTIFYFNGNFQLAVETPFSLILEKSIELQSPCNLVLFDYRGVGHSTGHFRTPKDLIIDSVSVLEWIKQRIGTIPSQIHFYGFSLGGAISALTKALDPEHLTGRLINDRSFSSSDKVICIRYGSGYFGKLMSWLFKQYGYSADPAEAFVKASGEKLIIYHPDDAIIPAKASMQYAIQHDLALRLEPKPGFEEQVKQNHHVAPLHWHEAAVERVIEFLFPFTSPFIEYEPAN
jgi:hypothetical protein